MAGYPSTNLHQDQEKDLMGWNFQNQNVNGIEVLLGVSSSLSLSSPFSFLETLLEGTLPR